MIRLDHVSKHFGGQTPALSDVTVEMKDGEFIFLIGPSGAGKTTLIRLLIRDLIPSQGNIFIDTVDVGKLLPADVHLLRRKIGTVFQDFKLLMERTVYENIAIVLEIVGKSPREIERAVTDVLELVGLAEKRHVFPLQLSAGEMQRVGLARAIVGGPKILLADEPTGNLDPETAWEILRILDEINSMGTTIVMATHNADIVNAMKKRTLTLHQGVMVADEEKGRYSAIVKHKTVVHPHQHVQKGKDHASS